MRILLADDDFISRKIMGANLSAYGQCDIAADGEEVLAAVKNVLDAGSKYDLICLDILMPKMNGQDALVEIRKMEKAHGRPLGHGAKVLMISSLSDKGHIMDAFNEQCDGYLVKPVSVDMIRQKLKELELI